MPRKFSRMSSNSFCYPFIPAPVRGEGGLSFGRQFHSFMLHQQTRGDSVAQTFCTHGRDLEWCITHHIFLMATHVPGIENVQADMISRGHLPLPDWELNWKYLKPVFQRGYSQVDIFATRDSAECQNFCSRGGWPSLPLDWTFPVHVSTPFSHDMGSPQTTQGKTSLHSLCSMVAPSTLVPTTPAVEGPVLSFPPCTRPPTGRTGHAAFSQL